MEASCKGASDARCNLYVGSSSELDINLKNSLYSSSVTSEEDFNQIAERYLHVRR